ncbi:MAG: hypothetical protein ABI647_23685 [Gemmatimonadota bacterium]
MNEESGTRLARQTALFLILSSSAVPLRAQSSLVSLDVCNNGTVPVVVMTATKNTDLARGFGKYYWAISSSAVASAKCKTVYSDTEGDGAYLGFGFEDTKGQWGSGHVAQVPDFGKYVQRFQTWPILSRGEGKIEACAPRVATTYAVKDDPKTDCASMRLIPSGGAREVPGPFFPITSTLYIRAPGVSCLGDMGAQGPCHYYLNISPNGTDRDLHATEGTGGGADADRPMTDAQVDKALGDMLAKAREKSPAQPPPAPPPPPRREPTLTMVAPAHDGYAIKIDPSMSAGLAAREQEKWKSPMYMVSAYDPKWIGQTLVLKGTVSRVEVESDGDPKWVHIYFKESPDATITGCSPFPAMLRKMFGDDLSALVGKTIEMAGQVARVCRLTASINIVDQAQIKLVQ